MKVEAGGEGGVWTMTYPPHKFVSPLHPIFIQFWVILVKMFFPPRDTLWKTIFKNFQQHLASFGLHLLANQNLFELQEI